MEFAIVLIFALGYLAIAFEHPLRTDKVVPALIMAALCWTGIALGDLTVYHIDAGLHEIYKNLMETRGMTEAEARFAGIEQSLLHHLGKTSEILFFLIGAMSIVETIDIHGGFAVIKKFVKTRKKRTLLWIFGALAFCLSAIIDNLTATIVLITILRKVVTLKEERLWYAGLIIIAANSGGAFSPIGDVTTTMLWIAGKVSAIKLVEYVAVPSILSFAIPFGIASFMPAFRGEVHPEEDADQPLRKYSASMLYLGLAGIIFVPIFKTVTELPPYMGMMLSLAVVWLVSEVVKRSENKLVPGANKFSVHHTLGRIEMSSILFFLGILLAVAALESLGLLFNFAGWLNDSIPNQDFVVLALGLGSAVVDNVPLVAASIGMFSEPMDAELWHFIAFAAGTGGSILIIGSAAGVAAMGMERINFIWYLRNIAWLALLGFLAGSFLIMAFKAVGLYGEVSAAVPGM